VAEANQRTKRRHQSQLAEPIVSRPLADPGFARTRAWMDAAAKSLYGDDSVSAEITGDSMSALPALLAHALVDVVECGIRPINEVALALRADAWRHAKPRWLGCGLSRVAGAQYFRKAAQGW